MNNTTKTYSDDGHTQHTQTYSSEATNIYSDSPEDVTRTYHDETSRTATSAHNLAVGDTITLNEITYTITGVISQETGEAVIYKIQDQQEHVFALKLYFEFPNPKEEPNPEALKRIQRITDPDILRLHDFGTGSNKFQGKYCFEICDFAQGGNLLIKQEYSVEFLRETIIPQIFKGIRTLHDHKIYHCDLKPENIFWLDVEQTDLVIGDYGSAKTFEESSDKDLRQTTTAKGTMFYLALEQSIGIISAKNDYYSFGMILLHLLYPNLTTRESLRQIRERQMSKKPIIDYNPGYGDLNDLIAGLTLADVSTRWGEGEVRKWIWGEKVPIQYTSDADIHPIKFSDATIRTPQNLVNYIDSHTNWLEKLIEDHEGYQALLRWVGDVQDMDRKKVFENMIKHYRQDGESVLKQAVLRYFAPDRPIRIDMQEYDLWNATDLSEIVTEFFKQLDESAQVTGLNKQRFYIFQCEFVLRQIVEASEGQTKLVATGILNKLEGVLNLSPKMDFNDYKCTIYPKIAEENFPIILCAFKQQKLISSIVNGLRQELLNIDDTFEQAEKAFTKINNEYNENEQQINAFQKSIRSNEKILGFIKLETLPNISIKLLFIAYPFVGGLWGYFEYLRWGLARFQELGDVIGSIIGYSIFWPFLMTLFVYVSQSNPFNRDWPPDSLDWILFLIAFGCSIMPAALVYLMFLRKKKLREQGYRKITTLEQRNSSFRSSLNSKQKTYNDLKEKKSVVETKLAYIRNEMHRVQTM